MFTAVVGGGELITTSTVVTLLLPFVAAALSVAALSVAAPTATAPSPARATTAIQGGSLDQALTDLARILAEGTRAQRAVVWL
ncbi:MAG TPA: hypothetical protein VFO16_18915, partial [Pseudonocardiaceae bacterium]|nr:hypothetical protein [Pseudonocardiaceae bacterium]